MKLSRARLAKAPFATVLFALMGSAAACMNGEGGPAAHLGPQIGHQFHESEMRRIVSMSPVPPPPPDETNRVADDPRAAAFGRTLFFDPLLSPSGRFACSTCHDPERGWGDGLALSQAAGITDRHAPTLWNVAWNRWYFWDGRADSLWSQAVQPIESPAEMASDRLFVAHAVARRAELRNAYVDLFGPLPPLEDGARFPPRGRPVATDSSDPLHQAWTGMNEADRDAVNRVLTNVTKAIAAFERTIVSTRSRFDIFVEGVRNQDPKGMAALSAAERHGLRIFVGRGNCFLCHSGPNLTDREFHNLGLASAVSDTARHAGVSRLRGDEFNARGRYSDDTTGPVARRLLYLAQNEEQLGQMKTPTLRNVARTAPYMHDGRFASLEDVVRFYSDLPGTAPAGHREELLVSLGLTDKEQADLVAFLRALTDESANRSLVP